LILPTEYTEITEKTTKIFRAFRVFRGYLDDISLTKYPSGLIRNSELSSIILHVEKQLFYFAPLASFAVKAPGAVVPVSGTA
jgi:hypothetical protein